MTTSISEGASIYVDSDERSTARKAKFIICTGDKDPVDLGFFHASISADNTW